mmetsp:Transcript_10601/g.23528  ORF Transcript_10601/g.23528 Transcript_10601/m.23528 type:complete len:209 (-) Transcript_10601:922-1548(-)
MHPAVPLGGQVGDGRHISQEDVLGEGLLQIHHSGNGPHRKHLLHCHCHAVHLDRTGRTTGRGFHHTGAGLTVFVAGAAASNARRLSPCPRTRPQTSPFAAAAAAPLESLDPLGGGRVLTVRKVARIAAHLLPPRTDLFAHLLQLHHHLYLVWVQGGADLRSLDVCVQLHEALQRRNVHRGRGQGNQAVQNGLVELEVFEELLHSNHTG